MNDANGSFDTNLSETLDRLNRRRRTHPIVPIRADIDVSFEFFPPDDAAGNRRLDDAAAALFPLNPEFVSVTYGAGGARRDKTRDALARLGAAGGVPLAAHLTCIGAPAARLDEALDDFDALGIRHIVALRGDPPRGAPSDLVEHGDYRRADQLVAAVKRRGDYRVSVAAYPEKHPESRDSAQDIDALKAKQDAGADQAITQFFFDTDTFLHFRDRAVAAGVDIPLIPGILPIHNFAGADRFARSCGSSIPEWMAELFSGLDEAPDIRAMVASTVATEQCARLLEHGVRRFHFYTLNRADLSRAVCHMLGVRTTSEADGSDLGREFGRPGVQTLDLRG